MRLPLALFTVIFAVALLGANSVLPPPVVVVFPLTFAAGTDPEAGSRLATLFATTIAQGGGVTVKPPIPGTARKDFLETARREGADYYITGYVTPLGTEASLVEQIVSTNSGIVVWSNTAQVTTYRDAAGQGELMRVALLRHAGRSSAAYEPAPAPPSTASPEPAARGEGNLSKIFKRRARGTATPASPSAAALASPPQPAAATTGTISVVGLNGAADPSRRAYAASAVVSALEHAGRTAKLVSGTSSELPRRVHEFCSASNASLIVGGTLSLATIRSGFSRGTAADVELLGYDCSGALAMRERAQAQASGRHDWSNAIDRAVRDAVNGYVHPASRPAPAGSG